MLVLVLYYYYSILDKEKECFLCKNLFIVPYYCNKCKIVLSLFLFIRMHVFYVGGNIKKKKSIVQNAQIRF